MGLAPFHSWLPDAHSEAPAPVSALLSGSLLNCALLAVIRLWDVTPDNLVGFCGGYLQFFGFLSLVTAAFFIINQKDFKRMLAYSSVEHMGLIVLLIVYCRENWWILHMLVHSLTKMALFLVAGNILLSYGTRSIAAVRGMGERLPLNSVLWLTGMLMICGTPPSPLFLTELQLVKSAGLVPGAAILLLLLVIFCGMSRCMIGMSSGSSVIRGVDRDNDRLGLTPALTMTVIVLLGIRFSAMLIWGV
jgi:hydrogenase-4 component F